MVRQSQKAQRSEHSGTYTLTTVGRVIGSSFGRPGSLPARRRRAASSVGNGRHCLSLNIPARRRREASDFSERLEHGVGMRNGRPLLHEVDQLLLGMDA